MADNLPVGRCTECGEWTAVFGVVGGVELPHFLCPSCVLITHRTWADIFRIFPVFPLHLERSFTDDLDGDKIKIPSLGSEFLIDYRLADSNYLVLKKDVPASWGSVGEEHKYDAAYFLAEMRGKTIILLYECRPTQYFDTIGDIFYSIVQKIESLKGERNGQTTDTQES